MSKMLFTIFILQLYFIGTPIPADEKPPHGIESVLYEIYQDWNTDNRPRAKRTVEQYHTQMVGDDRIVVILEPTSESDNSYGLADMIDRQGLREVQAEILAESRSLMRVSVPVSNLLELSKVSGVRFVQDADASYPPCCGERGRTDNESPCMAQPEYQRARR